MIITHGRPDVDACASAWAWLRFVVGYSMAVIEAGAQGFVKFVPASWRGPVPEGDVALDLEIGIKGEKRANGTVMSAFASVVAKLSAEVRSALAPLLEFVELQDSTGDGIYGCLCRSRAMDPQGGPWPCRAEDIPASIRATGMVSLLRSLERRYEGEKDQDYQVLVGLAWWFEGIYRAAIDLARATALARECYRVGKVAVNPHGFATSEVLYQSGVELVVWVDGLNLGVTRRRDSRVNVGALVRPIVERLAPSEAAEWFCHSAGFMAARGSQKSPVTTPSQVDPRQLCEELAKLV